MFEAKDGGWKVLRVAVDGSPHAATVAGEAAVAAVGDRIHASGTWTTDAKYGRRFTAASLRALEPVGDEAAERWLSSGAVEGITPALARRVRSALRGRLAEALSSGSPELAAVRGVGDEGAARISSAWTAQSGLRAAAGLLASAGAPQGLLGTARKAFGADAARIVAEEPYRLVGLRGCVFSVADAIAAAAGIPPQDPVRFEAAFKGALEDAAAFGDCGLPKRALAAKARALMSSIPARRPREDLLHSALEDFSSSAHAVEAASSIPSAPAVFQRVLFDAEERIAARLSKLASSPAPWDAAAAASRAAAAEPPPTQSQAAALALLASARFSILTGGPGVGKTHCLRALSDALEAQGLRVRLAAPTGRAARRMAEATGRGAETIHRLLGAFKGGFAHDAARPLPLDVLILDEASMLDVLLADAVLQALPSSASLVLSGDPDQLPSVGPGSVLADLVASGRFPTARLLEPMRQAEGSGVCAAAADILAGRAPMLSNDPGSDVFLAAASTQEAASALAVSLVSSRLPKAYGFDPFSDILLLSPVRKGPCGVHELNAALQAVLNPNPAESVRLPGRVLGLGDKVIQTRNDPAKDVSNGEMGRIVRVDRAARTLRVAFDGREAEYGPDDLDALDLGYALTVHKCQGSEAPCAVVVLVEEHGRMLARPLAYTALTRAKRLAVVVGSASALARAAASAGSTRRITRLAAAFGIGI